MDGSNDSHWIDDKSRECILNPLLECFSSRSLNLDKQQCEASGNTLTIKVPVREVLKRMLSGKAKGAGGWA